MLRIFDNRVLRKMFWPKGSGKDYISEALRSVLPSKYCSVDQIKSNEMGGTCGTYGGQERFMQDFGGET